MKSVNIFLLLCYAYMYMVGEVHNRILQYIIMMKILRNMLWRQFCGNGNINSKSYLNGYVHKRYNKHVMTSIRENFIYTAHK